MSTPPSGRLFSPSVEGFRGEAGEGRAPPPACRAPGSHCPAGTSHRLMRRSAPPVATVLPSGLNATDSTQSVCPSSVGRLRPVGSSHSKVVFARPPAATSFPSGLYATDRIELGYPLSV